MKKKSKGQKDCVAHCLRNDGLLATRSKGRRRREETLTFLCFSEETNESRDLDSYEIEFLNRLLTRKAPPAGELEPYAKDQQQ
jgi:hypothetical protein